MFGLSYQDTILLKPPYDIGVVSPEARQTYFWTTKHLHGIDWNSGAHEYSFLYTFLMTLKLRFPKAIVYVRGQMKSSFLRSHSFQVVELESVGCPKITQFLHYPNRICFNHMHSDYFHDDCSKTKAYQFYIWLVNKINNENGNTYSQIANSPNAPVIEPLPTDECSDATNGGGEPQSAKH